MSANDMVPHICPSHGTPYLPITWYPMSVYHMAPHIKEQFMNSFHIHKNSRVFVQIRNKKYFSVLTLKSAYGVF